MRRQRDKAAGRLDGPRLSLKSPGSARRLRGMVEAEPPAACMAIVLRHPCVDAHIRLRRDEAQAVVHCELGVAPLWRRVVRRMVGEHPHPRRACASAVVVGGESGVQRSAPGGAGATLRSPGPGVIPRYVSVGTTPRPTSRGCPGAPGWTIGCRAPPSGSMPAAPGRTSPGTGATQPKCSVSMRTGPTRPQLPNSLEPRGQACGQPLYRSHAPPVLVRGRHRLALGRFVLRVEKCGQPLDPILDFFMVRVSKRGPARIR